MSGKARRVCPEIKEIGITELYVPEDGRIVADLIFVHGLKGHPRKTWEHGKHLDISEYRSAKTIFSFRKHKHRNKDSNVASSSKACESCYWPFDLLPSDFNRLRILTYGYDSHPSHFYKSTTNRMNISQHGRNLLTRVTNSRQNCMTRPLIFVAHSLGGILVKDAVIESSKYNRQPHMQAVAKQCRAIFFFGTPHHGSSVAEWGLFLSNIVGALPGGLSTYGGVLRGLSPESEKLDSLTLDFNDMLNANIPFKQKIKVFTFQEAKGISSMAGLDNKVVPDSSSAFGRRDLEKILSVPENHMNMCRFNHSSNLTYQDFQAEFRRVLTEAAVAGNAGEGKFEKIRSGNHNEVKVDILEKLDFEGRRLRENQLGNLQTHTETLDWIWKSSFADWITQGDQKADQIFWIFGKPASGKSILMHHLSNSANLSNMLFDLTQRSWGIIYHFFDFRGSEGIRNNFEGFLRSLLYQLLEGGNRSEQEMQKNTAEPMDKHSWSIGYLRQALHSNLRQSSRPIFLLLDGLDEYKGNHLELVQFLRQIANNNVRLCLASRPEPLLEAAFENLPKLKMQDFNRAGIEEFVALTLEGSLSGSTFFDDNDLVSLSRNIGQRADGIFLWARFATYELAEGFARGEDLCELELRLEQVPPELEDIYSRIFSKLKPLERHEAGLMLQLICFAERPLCTEELMAAMDHAQTNSGFRLTKVSKRICRQFERKIISITGGVLEVFDDKVDYRRPYIFSERENLNRVQITHKTVFTYLDSKGWQEIFSRSHEDLWHPETLWLHICAGQFASETDGSTWLSNEFLQNQLEESCSAEDIEFATSASYSAPMSSLPDEAVKSAPLREYAAKCMLVHARKFEDTVQTPAVSLIRKSLTCSFLRFHWFFIDYHITKCDCCIVEYGMILCPRRPLQVAMAHGLARSVSLYLLEDTSSLDIGSNDPRLPFWLPEDNPLNLFILQNSDLLSHLKLQQSSFDFFESLPTNCEEMSLLEYAVHALRFHDSQLLPILNIIVQNDPQADDATMIAALNHSPLEAVCLLFPRESTGKLQYIPDQDPHTFQILKPRIRKILLDRLESDILSNLRIAKPTFSPLWIFARRGGASGERQDWLEFLRERGEEINDQCGPFGTALHSAILYPSSDNIKFLIDAGGDVHTQGLLGNPLEFAWLLLNTPDDTHRSDHLSYAVEILIENGAVNNKKDPNGCIPTQDWMLHVCVLVGNPYRGLNYDQEPFKRCKDLYAGSGPYPNPPPSVTYRSWI